jgi:hypothetical protein
MSIIDDLIANAGLYLGIDTAQHEDRRGAARIVITRLPGDEGVALDYEILNPAMPERPRGHVEHTMIGRTDDGGAVMVVASGHAKSVHVLRETSHGVFEVVGDEPSPYPAKVEITMAEPGKLVHTWWWGPAGGDLVAGVITEATLQA